MKAHYGDIGIINIIRQRLKDIELQRWLSAWGLARGGGAWALLELTDT